MYLPSPYFDKKNEHKANFYRDCELATLPLALHFTGESGLVYRGYLDSEAGRDMVAIKTCKGMKCEDILIFQLHIILP